jgi:hypothetical protein
LNCKTKKLFCEGKAVVEIILGYRFGVNTMRGVNFTEIFRNSMYGTIAIFFGVAIVFLAKSFPLISGAKTIETSTNTVIVSTNTQITSLNVQIAKLGTTVDNLNTTITDIGATATNLGKVSTVISNGVDRTLKEFDYPLLQAGLTAKKEADTVDGWNIRFSTTIDDLDDTIKTADTVVGGIIPLETATTESVNRFNAFMVDPKLALMEQHIGGILTNVDGITYTTNAVFTKATKDYLHPSPNPMKRAWHYVSPFVIPAAQVGGAVAIAIH